ERVLEELVGNPVGALPGLEVRKRGRPEDRDDPAAAVIEDAVRVPVDRQEWGVGPRPGAAARAGDRAPVLSVVVGVDILELVAVVPADVRRRDRRLLEDLPAETERVLVLVGGPEVAVDLT